MARLTINLSKIEHNAQLVAEMLRPHRVQLVGVTKACLGHPLVGGAMLAGGAAALADSRGENIAALRRHFPGTRLELMRWPCGNNSPGAIEADLFFVSASRQAEILSAARRPWVTRLCLMVETGDGREGVPPELAAKEAAKIIETEGAELAGLGTNAACARRPASLEKILSSFYEAADDVLGGLNQQSPYPLLMSAGGSGFLALLNPGGESLGKGSHLGPISELRCGEAILLGRIPGGNSGELFLPGAHRDAFVLDGEVVEVYKKEGVLQALLNFGLQDVGAAPLMSCASGMMMQAATSDYLAVSCSEPAKRVRIGDRLAFIPSYYALLAAMTSPFVEKIFRGADMYA